MKKPPTTSLLRRSLVPIVVLASLAACSTPGSEGPTRANAPIVVPAGSGSFFVFDATRVQRYEGSDVAHAEAVEASAGKPLTGALDLERGWAAAGYEKAIALVQTAEGTWTWIESTSPPTSLALGGDVLGLVCEDTIDMYGALDGHLVWSESARPWLRSRDLGRAWLAHPLSDTEFVLASYAGYGGLSGSRTVLQRIDRSRGEWRLVDERTVEGLSLLQACGSDGARICLAGVDEENRRGGGVLLQSLVVQLFDPATLAGREIVRDERHDNGTVVDQVAIGHDLAALVLNGSELKVYRIYAGISSAPVYRRTFGARISVAWVSPSEIAVIGDGEPQRIEIQ